MLLSLMFISRSALAGADAGPSVDNIVAASRRRNLSLDVSGALVFTGVHFAQILEGSQDALCILMARIRSDIRHDCVEVVRQMRIDQRSFRDWSMAYAGPSTHLAARLSPLLLQAKAGPGAPDAVERLAIAMQELGSQSAAQVRHRGFDMVAGAEIQI